MKSVRIFAFLLAATVSIPLMTGCNEVIQPGNVGILVNKTGPNRGVQSTTIVSGRVWYNPVSNDIIEYPVSMQVVKWTASADEGREGVNESITFTSKDDMAINADVSVSYQLDPAKAAEFYVKYRADDISKFTDGYLRNTVRNAFNQVGGEYNVEQIMGDNAELLKRVESMVRDEVGPDGIIIDKNGIGFMNAPRPPAPVVAAINAKVQATQDALKVQNEVATAEAEAKKRVAQAQGEADANRVLSSSINTQLVEWRKLELEQKALDKWDGHRPQVEGSTSGLMINLGDK